MSNSNQARLNGMLLIFWLTAWLIVASGQASSRNIIETSCGDFNLSIYLPPGYDTVQGCKVLYFNDGQSIFGRQGLNADGTADLLIRSGLIEPLIIVGIHSDQNRTSHYVPYKDEGARQDFGDYQPMADEYTRQLIDVIFPYIEQHYKTRPGRGIAGYSFGGLHATWAALNFPDQFAFAGSLSPSFWVSDFNIFKEGYKARPHQIYYFDVGTGEWNYYVPMLLHSQLSILQHIFYYEDEGGVHSISSWRGDRLKNILLLFAGKTDTSAYNWEIRQETIKSEFTGKFYLRINPVIQYSNGLKCSISYAATYSLLNNADGVVNKDGSFSFLHKKDLEISVSYKKEARKILIRYDEVEKIKARLR
jgi:enterochelin esterase-like enzyme